MGGKHRLGSIGTERTPEILETQEEGSAVRGRDSALLGVPSTVIHDDFRNIPQ